MADFGLKISKKNINVLGATDKQSIFNNKYKTFNIVQTGLVGFSVAGLGTQTIDVGHNLGYDPGFLVFFDVSGTGKRFLSDLFSSDLANNVQVSAFSRNLNTLRLYINNGNVSNQSGTIRYFIFADVGK